MPENVSSPNFADDQFVSDLVIDTFDQMHNTADLSLLASHFCGTGAGADAVDAA